MVTVMVMLAGLYAGIGAAIVGLYELKPTWAIYIAGLGGVIAVTAVVHLVRAVDYVLASAGVREASAAKEAKFQARLERLSALAELPTPRLAILEGRDPNAFTGLPHGSISGKRRPRPV